MRRLVRKVAAPIERFLAIQASSGIVLLVVALLALLWANSPWADLYQALWHTPLGVRLGPWQFERDLHFWINDGLMTVFFFVVGLEIRREVHQGELSELRRAALPLVAALGGMAVPALIYLAFNHGRASASGWGVPMATDIAFAVGVLALLGSRVVPAMRILLLALAVIDDVGAILVIALFYSAGIALPGLVTLGVGITLILVMQKVGARSAWAYLVPAILAWAGAYSAGVHPTLAGVVVGLLTPARAWLGKERFLDGVAASLRRSREEPGTQDHALLPHLDAVEHARREAVSPVVRLQHAFHGSVAYGVMPLFALANAGVPLGSASFEGDGLLVFAGVFAGLVAGKPLGIVGLSWVAQRAGWAMLPNGVDWRRVGLIGAVGGIGFTMALFIAALAFPPGPLLETAKLAVLVGSLGAAILAFVISRFLPIQQGGPELATSEAEAEASTER